MAAGMSASYKVKFVPESKADYESAIVCTTDREKFVIKIKTVGARGVIDIPPIIKMGR